jgi:hypothetical protein
MSLLTRWFWNSGIDMAFSNQTIMIFRILLSLTHLRTSFCLWSFPCIVLIIKCFQIIYNRRDLVSQPVIMTRIIRFCTILVLPKHVRIRIKKAYFACGSVWVRSLTLRKENGFEDRVLERIFGHSRSELTGMTGKLHKEELHIWYPSRSIINMVMSVSTRWTEM